MHSQEIAPAGSEARQITVVVRLAILVSAVLLVLLRLLSPFTVGHDQANQIEAAARFAAGLGVTSTNAVPTSPDIAQPAIAQPVTWWAPAFSVVIGSLLWLGIPVIVALKLLFAGVTLAGWFGWALLAERCLQPVRVLSRAAFPLHLPVAALLPFVFTPGWSRSDVFLWAGVPFVVLLLADRCGAGTWKAAFAAGCLLGLLIDFRYAALFLVPPAALMAIRNDWPDWKAMLRSSIMLGIGILLFTAPLLWFLLTTATARQGQTLPAIASAGGPVLQEASAATAFVWVLEQLPAVWYVFPGLWPIGAAALRVDALAVRVAVGGLGFLMVLWLVAVARRASPRALAIALSLIPIGLTLFLICANKGMFLTIRRYYDPAVLPVLFLLFAIAGSQSAGRFARQMAVALTIAASVYICVVVPAATIWSGKEAVRNVRTLPAILSKAFSPESPNLQTKNRMFELHQEYPDALWFAQNYAYYALHSVVQPLGPAPGTALRVLPKGAYWNSTFTSRPVRAFFVLHGRPDLPFVPQTDSRIVYRNPAEQTTIFMAEFPAGYAFKAAAAQTGRSDGSTGLIAAEEP